MGKEQALEKVLELEAIRTDGGMQLRPRMDPEAIEEYGRLLSEGANLPPVEVVYDGQDYWLWDGYHRLYGAKLKGITSLAAHIEDGTRDDALDKALGANAKHGLRRTPDYTAAVVRAACERFPNESTALIAARCGVGETTVYRYRPRPASPSGEAGLPPFRVGADGKHYPATLPPRAPSPTPDYEQREWDAEDLMDVPTPPAPHSTPPLSHAEQAEATRRVAYERMERFIRGVRDTNTIDRLTEAAAVWGEEVHREDAEVVLDILASMAEKCREAIRLIREGQQRPPRLRALN